MTALARLSTALSAVLLPALALAQYGQDAAADPAAPSAGYGWLWVLAVVAVLAVLAYVMFRRGRGRGGGTPPPARRSLGV